MALYHFYFVLALFDVVIIVASILLHHTTLQSFDDALIDGSTIHEQQRWLAELGTALIRLNAPGNDIFESHNIDVEQSNFARAKVRMHELLDRPPPPTEPLPALSRHIDRMEVAEKSIFERFQTILDGRTDPEVRRQSLSEATKSMAAMDRAQADAMAVISGLSLSLLLDQKNVLNRHQALLRDRTRIEVVFIVMVALILVGIFFYGRQLQRTHENLLAERGRVETERRNRLVSVGEVCFACAHGIRNPLAAIASSAQLILQYGALDHDSTLRVKDIVQTCEHLNCRVSKLLQFAWAPVLDQGLVKLEDILDQAAHEVKGQLAAQGITIQRSYGADTRPVRGDRSLLMQAVHEMLSNVLDQLQQGGVVTLVSQRHKDGVEFGVRDNGSGIPDEIKDQVCQLFFTPKAEGNGIGLASVKRTAELHGGAVVITDANPTGADVRIRVPVA